MNLKLLEKMSTKKKREREYLLIINSIPPFLSSFTHSSDLLMGSQFLSGTDLEDFIIQWTGI